MMRSLNRALASASASSSVARTTPSRSRALTSVVELTRASVSATLRPPSLRSASISSSSSSSSSSNSSTSSTSRRRSSGGDAAAAGDSSINSNKIAASARQRSASAKRRHSDLERDSVLKRENNDDSAISKLAVAAGAPSAAAAGSAAAFAGASPHQRTPKSTKRARTSTLTTATPAAASAVLSLPRPPPQQPLLSPASLAALSAPVPVTDDAACAPSASVSSSSSPLHALSGKSSSQYFPSPMPAIRPAVALASSSSDASAALSSLHNAPSTTATLERSDTAPPRSSAAPPNWQRQWELIERMRAAEPAPVDTVGCERLAEYGSQSAPIFRLYTLIGLMLSSQTKDEMTAKAVRQMQELARADGHSHICVPWLRTVSDSALNTAIQCVGFHNRKTEYIKQTAEILHTQYADDIPPTLTGLLALPGVGPKMAHLCLQVAWKRTEGIGVDVHVHRISNRLRWVRNTNEPEQTRVQLEQWLPRDHWRPVNAMLVGFGQVRCTPINPKCDSCLLAAENICPSASKSARDAASRSASAWF